MATVNKDIAMKVVNNNGYYPGDPQAYKVFTYKNLYEVDQLCYAIAYTKRDFARYLTLEIVDILWEAPNE